MKTLDVEQGTPEWLEARMGLATASEMDALVTPLWKIREGAQVDSYVAFKLAEKWLGHPIQTFSGGMMDQGKVREEEAVPAYEFQFDCTIQRVGFIVSDDGLVGASPDGLLEDGSGIEIKSPEPQKHVAYLLGGECPKDYRHQVQASMYVTGAKHWTFMSYCRGFPNLIVKVDRDEMAIEAIGIAANLFRNRFDNGWEKLVNRNGGEPVRAKPAKAKASEDTSWINPDGLSFEEILELPNVT